MKNFCLIIFAVLLTACSTPQSSRALDPSGYYTVQQGDTLSGIGRRFNQRVPDIVAWNRLSNANAIRAGQRLRVKASQAGAAKRQAAAKSSPKSNAKSPPKSKAKSQAKAPPSPPPRPALRDWVWPADGRLLARFGKRKNGIDIAGQSGQVVRAANGGTVSYVGSGIRGYGNLIIVKHDGNLLSVYAHNKRIVVQEGQRVDKGQKIAEMGNSDSDSVKLYFEIRHHGKPIDPSPYLPLRAAD